MAPPIGANFMFGGRRRNLWRNQSEASLEDAGLHAQACYCFASVERCLPRLGLPKQPVMLRCRWPRRPRPLLPRQSSSSLLLPPVSEPARASEIEGLRWRPQCPQVGRRRATRRRPPSNVRHAGVHPDLLPFGRVLMVARDEGTARSRRRRRRRTRRRRWMGHEEQEEEEQQGEE